MFYIADRTSNNKQWRHDQLHNGTRELENAILDVIHIENYCSKISKYCYTDFPVYVDHIRAILSDCIAHNHF